MVLPMEAWSFSVGLWLVLVSVFFLVLCGLATVMQSAAWGRLKLFWYEWQTRHAAIEGDAAISRIRNLHW